MKTEYCKNKIYFNSVPEFKTIQKQNGTTEMQIRYRNDVMGYLGKWMPIQTEQETEKE